MVCATLLSSMATSYVAYATEAEAETIESVSEISDQTKEQDQVNTAIINGQEVIL